MLRLLALLLLARPAAALPPTPTSRQERDFQAVLRRALKEGADAPVSSIAASLGFDRRLRSKLLRYRQDDSPDDAEHVFAVFYSSSAAGWRLYGAQVSRERGFMGIDGKTVVSGVAFRLDMRGMVQRAFEIPEGPIDALKGRLLAVNGKTIKRLRAELRFLADTVPRDKLKAAGS